MQCDYIYQDKTTARHLANASPPSCVSEKETLSHQQYDNDQCTLRDYMPHSKRRH